MHSYIQIKGPLLWKILNGHLQSADGNVLLGYGIPLWGESNRQGCDGFFDLRLKSNKQKKKTVEQTIETLMTWDATTLVMTSL